MEGFLEEGFLGGLLFYKMGLGLFRGNLMTFSQIFCVFIA
jgi:hypothetical protein